MRALAPLRAIERRAFQFKFDACLNIGIAPLVQRHEAKFAEFFGLEKSVLRVPHLVPAYVGIDAPDESLT